MSLPQAVTPPIATCLVFVAVGCVIALLGGLGGAAIAGGALAAAGAVPAAYGAWQGMQRETQGPLAIALGGLVLALGVGGVLIVLGVISFLR